MNYCYYILHISVADEEQILGPFDCEATRHEIMRKLRLEANQTLRDPRVRARFYPMNVASDVAAELETVKEAA